jgi:hypothetical protein
MTPPARLVADVLTVFVATKLVNPTNARGSWHAGAGRARQQREAVASVVWAALRDPHAGIQWHITAKPTTPKMIHFCAHVGRRFDTDGLVSSLKHVRDGLQDCGLIANDGPDSGHIFTYAQVVDRARRGVQITVTLRETDNANA